MTSDLQQTRYDKLVRRVGGIIGPGSKVAEALPELFPMIDVENLPPELFLLSGTRMGFGGGNIGAVVGESPRAQLFNPAGSNILVTVDGFILSAGSAGILRWGTRTATIEVAVDTQLLRDTREILPLQPAAVVRHGTDAAAANATGQTADAANTPFKLFPPHGVVVLAPGVGLEVGTDQQNTRLIYTFYWTEREALESELNLP